MAILPFVLGQKLHENVLNVGVFDQGKGIMKELCDQRQPRLGCYGQNYDGISASSIVLLRVDPLQARRLLSGIDGLQQLVQWNGAIRRDQNYAEVSAYREYGLPIPRNQD